MDTMQTITSLQSHALTQSARGGTAVPVQKNVVPAQDNSAAPIQTAAVVVHTQPEQQVTDEKTEEKQDPQILPVVPEQVDEAIQTLVDKVLENLIHGKNGPIVNRLEDIRLNNSLEDIFA
ncbi:MAG: hypothetical protein HQL54_07935 [Magnetococcales bacterium]|nr:hypothetical protein [Magnetococcales bacterium]